MTAAEQAPPHRASVRRHGVHRFLGRLHEVLDGVSIWNEFFTPLLYLGGTPNVTVPVQVYGFVGEYSTDWGQVFAGLLMASLPILLLFFVFQRYMIRSFGSGLKG